MLANDLEQIDKLFDNIVARKENYSNKLLAIFKSELTGSAELKNMVNSIIKVKRIHDSVINACSSYSQVREYLVFNELKAAQISSDTTVFTYVSQSFDLSKIVGDNKYKSRTGVEMTPQEIFMLSGVGESSKENCYRFRKKEFSNAKYVVTDTPSSGWDLPYHYIYPMLSAPNITPFHYDTANEFCIIPYDKDNLKKEIDGFIGNMGQTYFDYESDETTWATQPGQRIGKYKISEFPLDYGSYLYQGEE